VNPTEKVKRLYYKIWENLNWLNANDDEKVAHIAEVLLDDIDQLVKAIEQREWALMQKARRAKGAAPADWGVSLKDTIKARSRK